MARLECVNRGLCASLRKIIRDLNSPVSLSDVYSVNDLSTVLTGDVRTVLMWCFSSFFCPLALNFLLFVGVHCRGVQEEAEEEPLER